MRVRLDARRYGHRGHDHRGVGEDPARLRQRCRQHRRRVFKKKGIDDSHRRERDGPHSLATVARTICDGRRDHARRRCGGRFGGQAPVHRRSRSAPGRPLRSGSPIGDSSRSIRSVAPARRGCGRSATASTRRSCAHVGFIEGINVIKDMLGESPPAIDYGGCRGPSTATPRWRSPVIPSRRRSMPVSTWWSASTASWEMVAR